METPPPRLENFSATNTVVQGLFTGSPPTAYNLPQVIQSLEKHHTSLAERVGEFLDRVGGFENRRGVCVPNPTNNSMYSGERAMYYTMS